MYTLKLYNSLSKTKEEFAPYTPKMAGMYVCGPTVYDRAHLGNARAMVIFDVLFRILRQLFGEDEVTYIRNITDVDDKINQAARQRDVPISQITAETIALFHQDMAALLCLPPSVEPKATEHIPAMQQMIERLVHSNHAYVAEGHVLFDVDSFPQYGRLTHRSLADMIAGARVEIAPYKKNPADFVLWKPSSDDEPGWASPWGIGRPGWHIECSAMSTHYLGQNFDIHGGGADLQFPHHENEIAQSCCAHPHSHYARFWVHNGFLTVNGEKMSKSLGNFITMGDLLEGRHIKGEIVRYALLSTHYRKPLDWTAKLLSDATGAVNGFYKILEDAEHLPEATCPEVVMNALCDDVNTPLAFSALHRLASDYRKATGAQKKTQIAAQLKAAGKVLGFLQEDPVNWFASNIEVSGQERAEIEGLIASRKKAKQNKDWAEADRIRGELTLRGILLKDNPDGSTTWEKTGYPS